MIALSVVMGTAGTLALAASGPVALAVVGSALVGLAAGLPWTYAFVAAAEARRNAPVTAIAIVNLTGLLVIAAGVQLVGLSFSFPEHGRIGLLVMAVLWATSIAVLPQRRPRNSRYGASLPEKI